MSDFYRFPAMAKLDQYDECKQAEKVVEEAQELIQAAASGNTYYEADFDAMDTIHSAENFLRLRGNSEEALEMLRNLTIEKNRRRGYYGEDN